LPVVPTRNESSPACILPAPEPSDKASFGKVLERNGPHFDPVFNKQTGDSTFSANSDITWTIHNNRFHSEELYRWDVNDAAPANARYRGERRNVFTIAGNEIDLSTIARIESDATHFHISFTKTLRQNGSLVRERTWTDRVARRFQ
jgi:hypothetical protein